MPNFKPQKMVGWFDIKQLAGTAVKAGLSEVFGSYADKRETMAAISPFKIYDYSATPELWIDYISDTGDGFNSTYTMAHLLAQPALTINQANALPLTLPKSKLLVLGGDQVYPVATRKTYAERFAGPFESAWPRNAKKPEDDMFALAGNHDWYDGLTNFMKIFCQNRTTGNWRTKQNRSYFAIKLTANTWLWGIDIQLDADIDKPQLDYFDRVTTEYMNEGDNIILCTAEPSWVFNTTIQKDESYKNLSYFECKYITDKKMNLLVSLAGDLHHYSHYSKVVNDKATYHKITAGGGGAFMHPTHNLPEELSNLREGNFKLQKTFPEKADSRKMLFGNFKFFYHNWSFGVFMALIYLLFTWLLEIGSKVGQHDMMLELEKLGISNLPYAMEQVVKAMVNSPAVVILIALVIVGLWKFCDTDCSKSKYMGLLGLTHGLLHVCLMFAIFWSFAYFNYNYLHLSSRIAKVNVLALEILVLGGILGSWLMAIYLMVANMIFKIHDNEAYSGMKIPHYKNFLRMQVKDNVLTIYPIGVKKTARWQQVGDAFKTKDKIEPELIERKPIVVPLSNNVAR